MSALADTTRRPGQLAIYRTSIWSTRVDLVVTDPGVLVTAVGVLHAQLELVDGVASRFRPDSEIERLHRSAGADRPVRVSPELLEAVSIACRAAMLTDGAVDPTVGNALSRLGYDRDFSLVARGREGTLPAPTPVPGWQSVVVEPERSTITLPADTVLDLGATAKAWAADRAASAIADRLGCGALVSLGGDLAIRDAPESGFDVGIADICGEPSAPIAVTLASGGLATSGIGRRAWMLGDHRVHHLVDPATGLPVDTPWRTVSVAAATCVDANTASTAAMVKGATAVEWLEDRRLPARLVAHDGSVVTVGGWPDDPRDVSRARHRRGAA
jgi:thiamine biosynthesis lipoprotein